MEQLKKIVRPIWVNYFHWKNRLRFERALKSADELNIVVGSSGKYEEGWLPTERYFLNLLDELDWYEYFEEGSIKNILAEHVLEHLTLEDGIKAAKVCHKFLKKSGRFRIAVPDGYHPDEEYIEYVKVNGWGRGADDHKVLYNYDLLGEVLGKAGFSVNFLEYYDEQGRFCSNEWLLDDGFIYRRAGQGKTNPDGVITYTSLIVDAIKH